MEPLYVELAVLCLTCAAGWLIIAYSGYASPRGWPVGAWFAADFSWLQALGYLAIIAAPVIALVRGPWWLAIVVLVAASILVRVALPTFRANAQWIALFGTVAGLLASAFIAISEQSGR